MRRGANRMWRRTGVSVSLLGLVVLWFGTFQSVDALTSSHFEWGRLVGPALMALAGIVVGSAGDALRPRDERYKAMSRGKVELTLEDRAGRVQTRVLKVLLFLSGWTVVSLLGDLHANSYAIDAVGATIMALVNSETSPPLLLMAWLDPLHA